MTPLERFTRALERARAAVERAMGKPPRSRNYSRAGKGKSRDSYSAPAPRALITTTRGEGRGEERKPAKRRTAPKKSPDQQVALGFRASPVHPGRADMNDPRPSPIPRAERRARLSAGQLRRNAPAPKSVKPPRTDPDVRELVETFAPAPTPPGPIAPVLWTPPASPPRPEAPPAPAVESDEARIIRLTAEAQAQRPPPAPPPAPSANARGQCKAVDPYVGRGRRCLLPDGHEGGHRHERGPFTAARPREDLELAAWRGTA